MLVWGQTVPHPWAMLTLLPLDQLGPAYLPVCCLAQGRSNAPYGRSSESGSCRVECGVG